MGKSHKQGRNYKSRTEYRGERHKELDSIKELVNQGKISKALAELDRYTELHPMDPYGRFLYGKLLMRNNNIERAKTEFESVAHLHGKNRHSGLTNLARIYWLQGDIEKAKEYYEEAIEDNPYGQLLPYLALAHLERESGQYYTALGTLYRGLERSKTSCEENYTCNETDLRLEIVKNLLLLNNEEEAEEMLKTVRPTSRAQERKISIRKGSIARSKGQIEEAIAYFESSRDFHEKDKEHFQATLELARLYRATEQIDLEIDCLEELFREEKYFDGEVPVLLAGAKFKKQDYTGAKEALKVGINTNDFDYRNSAVHQYSAIQYLEGDITGAEATLVNAIKRNQSPDELNYLSLIRILYDQGRLDEARKYLREICSQKKDIEDSYSFSRIEMLLDQKEGKKPHPKSGYHYLEHQIMDFSEESAISHIKKYYLLNDAKYPNFPAGTNIEQIYQDIQVFLDEDHKLVPNLLDEYEIPYPNAGYRDGIILDTIRVKTLPGTKQIVTMHPCEASIIPTKGALRQEKAKQMSKANSQTNKFLRRFGLTE